MHFVMFVAMRPSILIIYFSQTGQLRQIVDSIFSNVIASCEIEFAEIKPVKKFPFPWKAPDFFDCMPESVLQIAEPIEPMQFSKQHYDLVVVAYQPWFLSPSIPITSFLKSEYAQILKNQKVLTVIGARNMWLNAQEKIKQSLLSLNATLVGNIVLVDKNPNLTSVLTIIRWTFTGQKEATKRMPEAGVQRKDIEAASRFGAVILHAIQSQQTETLHENLLSIQSVELAPGLVILEKRGITNFRKFAKLIHDKGERGNPNRKGIVKLFQRLLIVGVFILSPISSFTAKVKVFLNKKSLLKEVEYFKNIAYHENAI